MARGGTKKGSHGSARSGGTKEVETLETIIVAPAIRGRTKPTIRGSGLRYFIFTTTCGGITRPWDEDRTFGSFNNLGGPSSRIEGIIFRGLTY